MDGRRKSRAQIFNFYSQRRAGLQASQLSINMALAREQAHVGFGGVDVVRTLDCDAAMRITYILCRGLGCETWSTQNTLFSSGLRGFEPVSSSNVVGAKEIDIF